MAWLTRSNLVQATYHLTETHPDRTELQATIRDIVNDSLTAFPDQHVSTHFHRVCEALDIAADRLALPPHLESQLRPPDHPPPPD